MPRGRKKVKDELDDSEDYGEEEVEEEDEEVPEQKKKPIPKRRFTKEEIDNNWKFWDSQKQLVEERELNNQFMRTAPARIDALEKAVTKHNEIASIHNEQIKALYTDSK